MANATDLFGFHAGHQKHLDYKERVNRGGYYTPDEIVEIGRALVKNHIKKDSFILDNACGYGSFLSQWGTCTVIGCDSDAVAVQMAQKYHRHVSFFHRNALQRVDRKTFHIPEDANLVIVGNPPYNDRTSLIRRRIKQAAFEIDDDLRCRDLGMSFLLAYNKLRADIVCVLHPLSYIIKKANFQSIKEFMRNYRLMDGRIVSSACFAEASKTTHFPIIIALYKRHAEGMTYEDIKNFVFKIQGGGTLCLNRYEFIDQYIDKYPKKKKCLGKNPLFFWTMRDINALKRNKTFVKKYSHNAVVIDKNKLNYYIYVDVFKRNLSRIPYYFGNCDVMIQNNLYSRYRGYFLSDALQHHPYLKSHLSQYRLPDANKQKINEYFFALLGECHASTYT
ncbi:MAG: N-6 DNA methylase [Alphaproteobacteria bacterium GM202ARS2]|nr:N-6 DNA methylase [Alphaproteobacteria bacterium GM202ARS2]